MNGIINVTYINWKLYIQEKKGYRPNYCSLTISSIANSRFIVTAPYIKLNVHRRYLHDFTVASTISHDGSKGNDNKKKDKAYGMRGSK